MDDKYKTISTVSQGLYKEKGSKFISIAIPVSGKDDIKMHLEKIRKEHHSARHYCYAWATGYNREECRFNDDGEPSGTAGKPIYGQILSFDITNTLIIVVRYFGGIKLGTGGLITAYKNAAADALNNSNIITKTRKRIYRLYFDYNSMPDVMRIFKENNLEQINPKFELDCTIDFKVNLNDAERITSKFDSLKEIRIENLYEE